MLWANHTGASFMCKTGLCGALSGVSETHLPLKSNDIYIFHVTSTFSSRRHLGAIFSSERVKAEDRKAQCEGCVYVWKCGCQ